MSDATHPSRNADAGSPIVALPRAHTPKRPPDNLPLELDSFVGRERELAEVKGLLAGHRLLTLTGPGGCGKTRLALRVAADLVEEFEGGVWWVEMASLADPALVPQAVASALSVREAPGHTLTEMLVNHLKPKKILLVLDNCEHLVDACAGLADALLRACPKLRILATSRETLGVAGERAWLVPSLSLPDPERPSPIEELTRYEAVRLFVERAKSSVSTFALTEQNAPAVARLCRRLDGMPLAIELAAARVRVLSAEQISARLDDCFRLLTGGSRTVLPRHRTLRAAIDWSYEPLSENERVLFRRLSVFAGGWALEAAEAVCAGEGLGQDEVLDLLSQLVDKSLVLVEGDGDARYWLLEPVRQYGRERLEESGEAGEVGHRHAGYFLALAEQAELKGLRQTVWMERLETEHSNLRMAMRWLLEEGAFEAAARLAWALWLFLFHHGHQVEGRRWIEEVLAKGDTLPTDLRAKALYVKAATYYGLISPEQTIGLLEESAALFRRVGNRYGEAIAVGAAGLPALQQGDMKQATMFLEEGVRIYREVGDKWETSTFLAHLGMIPLSQGDHERAVRYFEEALTDAREAGNKFSGCVSLYNLALLAQARGDRERAAELYTEGLELAGEIGDKANAAYCLEGLAGLAVSGGEPERAARLFGAAEALLEAGGAPLYAHAQDRALYERAVEELRSRLGEAAFEAAWTEGRVMTLEEAVAYVLSEPPPAEPIPLPDAGPTPARVKARPELRIFALGPARVERGEHVLTSSDWTYAKARELLYYLLCHPSRTKEQIGLALWPDASTAQLRRTFHVTLHHLRRALGGAEWISFQKNRYAFNRSLDYWFDVEAFESNLVEARRLQSEAPARAIPYLEEAVKLYEGDFLEDFVDGDWAMIQQGELRRMYQEALLTLGRVLFAADRYAEATDAFRRAITHDNLLEVAHRELIRCYARQGESGQALRHYQSLVELLGDELGSAPAPETTALFERLRRGEDI